MSRPTAPAASSRAACLGAALVACLAPAAARAGVVTGRLDLPPPPERSPQASRGFLERSENPLAPLRPVDPTPWTVVVLEGGPPRPASAQVTWDLRGDSFATPVLVVPAGTEVVIKNSANAPRSLAAVEAPKLLPGGPLNPSGTRSFRVPEGAQRYTIRDADAPHVRGTLVVIAAGWAVAPDATGRFEFPDVPDGTYKLRVWYREGWIDRTDDPVVVGGKAKVELKPRIPAGYPLVKAAAPAAGGPT